MAAGAFASPDRALELATTLERSTLSGSATMPTASRELDLQLACLVADHARAGGEAFMNRQLRYLSPHEETSTGRRHTCGETLLGADYDPLPLPLRRRVWLCPLCGVVGESPRGRDLPRVTLRGTECMTSPLPPDVAPDGCAVALVWFPVGRRESSWSVARWIDRPTSWPLQTLAHDEFGGVRFLVAVMVADADVITVRVPLLVSADEGRTYALHELNRA